MKNTISSHNPRFARAALFAAAALTATASAHLSPNASFVPSAHAAFTIPTGSGSINDVRYWFVTPGITTTAPADKRYTADDGVITVTGDASSGGQAFLFDQNGALTSSNDYIISGVGARDNSNPYYYGAIRIIGCTITGSVTIAGDTRISAAPNANTNKFGYFTGSFLDGADGPKKLIIGASDASALNSTIVWTGDNTGYTGDIELSKYSALQIGNGAAEGALSLGSNKINLSDTNSFLNFNTTSTVNYSGAISGAGKVTVNMGTLAPTVSASLANTGGISLTGTGTFDISNMSSGATVAAISGTSGTKLILGPQTLTVNGTVNSDFGGEITGTGGLIKDGTGALTLTHTTPNSNFSGPVVINQGILSIGTGPGSGADSSHVGALGTGSITVNTGGTLRLWIRNNANHVFNTNSELILNGGKLLGQDGQSNHWQVPVTLAAAGGTFEAVYSGKNLYIESVISGPGSLTINSGAAGVYISGNNTYAGSTTVTGTLLVGDTTASANGTIGTGALILNSSANADFRHTTAYILSNLVSSTTTGVGKISDTGGRLIITNTGNSGNIQIVASASSSIIEISDPAALGPNAFFHNNGAASTSRDTSYQGNSINLSGGATFRYTGESTVLKHNIYGGGSANAPLDGRFEITNPDAYVLVPIIHNIALKKMGPGHLIIGNVDASTANGTGNLAGGTIQNGSTYWAQDTGGTVDIFEGEVILAKKGGVALFGYTATDQRFWTTIEPKGTLRLGSDAEGNTGHDQIADNNVFRIFGGTFNLFGQSETVANISTAGGRIISGAGTKDSMGNTLSSAASASANLTSAITKNSINNGDLRFESITLTGTLTLSDGTGRAILADSAVTGAISVGTADILEFSRSASATLGGTFSAALSGAGVVVKSGPGTLILSGISKSWTGGPLSKRALWPWLQPTAVFAER